MRLLSEDQIPLPLRVWKTPFWGEQRRLQPPLGCVGPGDVSNVLSVSHTLYHCAEAGDIGGKPCNADNTYMHSWNVLQSPSAFCVGFFVLVFCFNDFYFFFNTQVFSGPMLTDKNGSLSNSGNCQLCSQLPRVGASCTTYPMCTSPKYMSSEKCWWPEHLNESWWWWYIELLWSSLHTPHISHKPGAKDTSSLRKPNMQALPLWKFPPTVIPPVGPEQLALLCEYLTDSPHKPVAYGCCRVTIFILFYIIFIEF